MDYTSIAQAEPDYGLCLIFSDFLLEAGRDGEASVLRWLAHNRLWPTKDELIHAPVIGVWWCLIMSAHHWLTRNGKSWWLPREAVGSSKHYWYVGQHAYISTATLLKYNSWGHDFKWCDDPLADCLEWACRNVDLKKVPEESLPKEVLLKC